VKRGVLQEGKQVHCGCDRRAELAERDTSMTAAGRLRLVQTFLPKLRIEIVFGRERRL
jgi:hypothetical protein